MSDDFTKAAEAVAKAAEAASKLIPVQQVYEDGPQGAVKELGKAATDSVRVARLLMAPVQLLSAYQVRFERFCKRLADRVPEERRVEVPARVSGPVLEALRYIEEQDLVAEYMLNLLASAMDSEHASDVHPSFASLASQLSRDEALILFHLKRTGGFRRTFTQELHQGPPKRFSPPVYEVEDFPKHVLTYPQNYSVCVSHLYFMGLAHVMRDGDTEYLYDETVSPRVQTGVRNRDILELTDMGKMFVKACVPDELPAQESRP